jgi:NhaA family Na+:H+ antiporter
MMALHRIQVRAMPVFVLLGAGVWLATFESGIHPTIAGAALGLLTPAYPFQRPRAVSEEAHRTADETVDDPEPVDVDAHHWLRLAHLSREAVSPLSRLESLLHPWTSYVIVPIFALTNAGVSLSAGSIGDAFTGRIALGVILGLVLGKTAGISLAARLAIGAGLARLPQGVRWRQVVGVAAVAGIGFTVSLFMTNLAFTRTPVRDQAKVGILVASLIAGALGAALLRYQRGPRVTRSSS